MPESVAQNQKSTEGSHPSSPLLACSGLCFEALGLKNFQKMPSIRERVGLFDLQSVVFFVVYGKLAWSFLFLVEIQFGLLCLRWKIGLVFFAYGSPRLEIGFGLLCLRFPRPELGLVFSAYGLLTVSKKDEPQAKKTSIVGKKDASVQKCPMFCGRQQCARSCYAFCNEMAECACRCRKSLRFRLLELTAMARIADSAVAMPWRMHRREIEG